MLLFFDIDGTLVPKDDPFAVPQSAVDAITRARANGHTCMINTGRTMRLVGDWLFDKVPFDGVAAGCGTNLWIHGEEKMHKTFSEEESRRIIDGIHRHGFDACLEGQENNYMEARENIVEPKFWQVMVDFSKMEYGSYDEAVGKFDKFYAYSPKRERIMAFLEEFADLLEYVDRKGGYYEIMPKGHSKASAVENVARLLDIPMSETVAIGDSTNDLPMLEAAATAIVMGNATEDVKAMADFVTTDVAEDGIANALAWLGIL